MGTEIDRLEIIIESEMKKASADLDKVSEKLGKLATSLTAVNTSGLRNFSSGIKQLSSAMKEISTVKTTDFNKLTKGIEKLSTINESALYKSANGIRNFANSLNSIGSISGDAVKLSEVAKNISKFGGVSVQRAIENLPRLSVALREFMTTLSSAPNVSENIIRMTNAMSQLASNGAKFSSTINGLGRAAKTLVKSNDEVSASHGKLGKSFSSVSGSASSLISKLGSMAAAYYTLRQAVEFVGSSIKKSMDFTETINLFQTSYKKIGLEGAQSIGMEWGSKSADAYAKAFIDRAQAFNDKITSALSLDPNIMMNYQAVFAQISSAMGLTANTAENISESFTLLGNDIASLWNIKTEDAMTKLQAGLTGQVRPLRELGIDITQASLQQTAYNYGITQSVQKMSQAEKVQLRWLTIMNQSSVAFGDMAKTINSPANQLRILQQQWNNLSRSIGNVFMPIVTAVLPYINALVIALRSLVDTFAAALGYELPDYSNSNIYKDVTGDLGGVSDGMDNVGDSADKATKANEKLKRSLMGFDQINILQSSSSNSSGSGNGGSGGGSGNGGGSGILDGAINDKAASYMAKFNEQLQGMSDKSKAIAENIEKFFGDIAKKAKPTTDALAKLWNDGLSKLAGFVGTALIDLYKDFMVPVGTWILGKGLPDLFNIINKFLANINWAKLNKGFSDLFKALAPFTIAIGTGLINFVGSLVKSITPALNTALGLFSDGLSNIALLISLIPSPVVEALGGAIGGFITAILGFSAIAKSIDMIYKFKFAIEAILKSIQANPILLLAGAIGALIGAFNALDKASFDASAIGQYDKKVNELVESSQKLNKQIDDLIKKQNDRNNGIEDEYGGIQILADKYFALSGKQKLTNDQQALLKSYASELIKKIPELSKYINAQTGAYKGTRDEIQKVINKSKEYYLVQAAQESLTEIAKAQYEAQSKLTTLESKRKEIIEKLTTAQRSLKKELADNIALGESGSTAAQKQLDIQYKYDTVINTLNGDLNKTNTEIANTSKSQSDLNNQWDYATDYISKYSNTAVKELPKVPTAVQQALEQAKNKTRDFKMPPIKIGASTAAQQALEAAKKSIKNVKLPSVKINVEFNEKVQNLPNVNGKKVKIHITPDGYAYPEVYAKGGFPTGGQLFVANEAGPELVGNMGGQTTVANHYQIERGIEEAAYRGQMRANMQSGSSGGGQDIYVTSEFYADSEKMYSITQKGKAKSERRFRPSPGF